MIESATGIILRTRLLTETSLIVQWLTPEFGRLATVAKGARRPKSAFAGKLDLFYECDFSFSRSRRSELHVLREASLADAHGALRSSLGLLQQAAYCSALIEQTTETETPLPAIFKLMHDLLGSLSSDNQNNVLAFELKLLHELGLAPEIERTSLGLESQAIAGELVAKSWTEIKSVRIGQNQFDELRRFLHGFLIYHLGRIPAGRAAALGLF